MIAQQTVRAQAREYWITVRFHRADLPNWLVIELNKTKTS